MLPTIATVPATAAVATARLLFRAPQTESDPARAATTTTATGATADVSATAGNGGAHAKAGKRKEPVEWGVYLRTPEDEERTKREWEKEHREWIEDQVRNGEGRVRVLSPSSFICIVFGA